MKAVISVITILILCMQQVGAQIVSVRIGIDGLTCSMCSYSVENSLRKLPYVAKVEMDLNGNVAMVSFHNGRAIDPASLAQKVRESGFSVRDFHATILPSGMEGNTERSFKLHDKEYLVQGKKKGMSGDSLHVKFWGKGFMSAKDYKSYRSTIGQYGKKVQKGEAYLVSIEN